MLKHSLVVTCFVGAMMLTACGPEIFDTFDQRQSSAGGKADDPLEPQVDLSGVDLLVSDGTLDSWGNLCGCGASRVADNLIVTARHCAGGGAKYVKVYSGVRRQEMQLVATGRKWIAVNHPGPLYGRDVAFMVLEQGYQAGSTRAVAGLSTTSEAIPTTVLAWDNEAPEDTDPSYRLTPHPVDLLRGPLEVDEKEPVRDHELYHLDPIVMKGDSGSAVLDESGAIVGTVSRGLRRRDLGIEPQSDDESPMDYVGAVWGTISGFCAELEAGGELLVSQVVDWRLSDTDPITPEDDYERAAADRVKAICAGLGQASDGDEGSGE